MAAQPNFTELAQNLEIIGREISLLPNSPAFNMLRNQNQLQRILDQLQELNQRVSKLEEAWVA